MLHHLHSSEGLAKLRLLLYSLLLFGCAFVSFCLRALSDRLSRFICLEGGNLPLRLDIVLRSLFLHLWLCLFDLSFLFFHIWQDKLRLNYCWASLRWFLFFKLLIYWLPCCLGPSFSLRTFDRFRPLIEFF